MATAEIVMKLWHPFWKARKVPEPNMKRKDKNGKSTIETSLTSVGLASQCQEFCFEISHLMSVLVKIEDSVAMLLF
jgi:hypothetical protein